jgi:hypothetical protein
LKLFCAIHSCIGALLAIAVSDIVAGDAFDSTGILPDAATEIDATDSLPPDIRTSIPTGIFYGQFTKEDGPFLILGSVTVPSGQALEFGPGSVVYVGGNYSTITVFGQMIVRGTREEPVVFMSARKHPNPWDWDRIYCRSRNRSLFEHCTVRHANYGITVENGSAEISNCLFERNSLYGVAVKNSEVSISASTFRGGHVLGLLLSSGARVTGDSLVITDNTTGIGCDGNAALTLTKGIVASNINGIVVSPDASVSIKGCVITRNKTGIVTEKAIPKKSRAMIFSNVQDEKITAAGEILTFLKEPEAVRSVVLPKTQTTIAENQGFTPGFAAASLSSEGASSFIGNVTAGARYFDPAAKPHQVQDTVFPQTLYPSGFQPELQLFASGKRGATDINLLMDIYSNPWLSTEGYFGKNMVNLSLNHERHSLIIGDFFESGSETSIGGRQMSGVKYTGRAGTMGGGLSRIEYKLAAGESEAPKDWGHHDLNQYNVIVDSGMSIRQQLTYILSTTIRPTRNSTFQAEGIIARDQTGNPVFRKPLTDPGAPKPVEAQTGCLMGTVSFLDGAVELFTEIDLGTIDTIGPADMSKISWYDPRLNDALPKIFNSFVSSKIFQEQYAFLAGGRGLYSGYTLNASVTDIGPRYFSAGNPYLEAFRTIGRFDAEKQYSENTMAGTGYIYESAKSSGSPITRNSFLLKGEHALGENRPAFVGNVTCKSERATASEKVTFPAANPGGNDSAAYVQFPSSKWITNLALEGKQTLSNGMSYSCGYQLVWDNDVSEHASAAYKDYNDRLQHQGNGWFTFRVKKIIKNKISARVTRKNQNRDSVNSWFYQVGDQLTWTVIPRKLTFMIAGEASNKDEQSFRATADSAQMIYPGWQDPVLTKFYAGDIEAKWTVTPRLAVVLKGRYEQSYDMIQSSRQNYDVKTAGLYVTYLF